MKESSVPVFVLSKRRDDAEYFNKTMRDAGHPVRCKLIPDIDTLEAALDEHEPHLLIAFADSCTTNIRDIAKLRQLKSRMTPFIVVRESVDEPAIGDAMRAGAQDLVARANQERILAVCERELRAFRLEKALNDTLRTATQYKRQLREFMSSSTDAIAVIQEGIVVEANQTWADFFTRGALDAVHAPLMDCFAAAGQATLKGALIACAKGQWDSDGLRVEALTGEGKAVSVELRLEACTHDGESATRIRILRRPQPANESTPESLVTQALTTDPVTGFFLRQQFLELLTDKLDHRSQGGARALAFIRPDKFSEIEREVGPVSSEEILAQLAAVLGRLVIDSDICGRFGGTVFAIVLERGSLRDIEAWAENALARIADNIFEVADRSLSLTCSIGLAELGEGTDRVEELVGHAERANQRCRREGGNRVIIEETADESTRVKRADALWVRQIRSALMDGRFRLVHLNIASLSGKAERMVDTVVRMLDEQGDEIAAGDFMGSATRNNLLRPIDRWVVDASFAFSARQANDLVLVKLSHESILDPSLLAWMQEHAAKASIRPASICFQVSENDASQYQKQTRALSENVRRLGFRFAVEQFGIGRDPLRVLTNIPMDFVKFDGSLMQGLADDFKIQEKVRAYVSSAARNQIRTIAARVENANTMAVLFQLGVGYMQGHYLHEPEVVLEAAS